MNNFRKTLPTALLAVAAMAMQPHAHAGVLYPDPSMNINLANDEYVFAGAHPAGTNFLDELQFSLSTGDHVTATVDNTFIEPLANAGGTAKLMDNRLLTLSLFDNNGNFIAATGTGGTLSADVTRGVTYTLAISGKTSGIFGGVYDGKLTADAPLPPAISGFGAALLTLGLRRKLKTDKK